MLEAIQQFDVEILLWIQENLRVDFLDGFWKGITFLGNSGWFWIALGIGLICFRRTRKAGITVLFALLIGFLITNVVLKNVVARIRPYDYTDAIQAIVPAEHDFSFPSGHTCASFAAALACYQTLPKKWGVAALVLAGFIAVSRLYVGVHYPTDVLGGLFVGLFAGAAAFFLVKKLQEKQKQP